MNWLGDRRVLAGFVLAWAVFTVGAFWELEGQYLRPAPRPAGAAVPHPGIVSPIAWLSTDRGQVRLARPNGVILLNFWNPSCPCSRFMEGHVRELGDRYGPQGVGLVTVVERGSPNQGEQEAMDAWKGRGLTRYAAVYDHDGDIARKFGVWAPPAAVIIDRSGHVAYVGAYNVARFCDDTHSAYAAMALAAVMAGHKPPRATTPFYGCTLIPAHD